MAETKAVNGPNNNKLAMSRALGAAFLTHQVEQLEKTVSADTKAQNWKERKLNTGYGGGRGASNGRAGGGGYGGKRGLVPVGGIKVSTRRKGGESEKETAPVETRGFRKWGDERKEWIEKDADIVVLDASVLVNALAQVKKWCRDGRSEVLIVPLEALNTLDLLKKGSSHLAQRARAASRVLEAQVGANPRVRVQQDSAFVLWDSIPFKDQAVEGLAHTSMASPEWVRRTICCAQWEANNANAEVVAARSPATDTTDKTARPHARVVLATLSQSGAAKGTASESPVPLPAPHASKHEPRATGTMVSFWAKRAQLDVFEVAPAPADGPRTSEEDERERPKRGQLSVHMPGSANSNPHRGRKASAQGGYGSDRDKGALGGGGLVERPPAVKTMMDIVAQPSKVVRVLARGEKLDP